MYFYAPTYSTFTNYNVWDGTTGNSSNTAVKALGTSATATTLLAQDDDSSSDGFNQLLDGSAASATVSVYIYFEDEDSNHTTKNLALKDDNITITVKFSTATVAAKSAS